MFLQIQIYLSSVISNKEMTILAMSANADDVRYLISPCKTGWTMREPRFVSQLIASVTHEIWLQKDTSLLRRM